MLWAGPENSAVISAYERICEIELRGDEIHGVDKDRRESNYNWILKHRRDNRIVIRGAKVNWCRTFWNTWNCLRTFHEISLMFSPVAYNISHPRLISIDSVRQLCAQRSFHFD